MLINKPIKPLELGDTGGLRVERVATDKLKFTIFELIRGHEVDRANAVLPLSRGVDLIKILCRQCGVKMEAP